MAKKINVVVVFNNGEWDKIKKQKGNRTWETVVRDGLEAGD